MTRLRFVGRPARGEVETPGGKSHAIRAAFVAAQAAGASAIAGVPLADDVDAAVAWLRAAGVSTALDGATLRVEGLGAPPRFDARFDARDAAAVLRFGLFWLASGDGRAEIDGSARLRERPIGEGLEWLRALGAGIEGERLPLRMRARGLRGGELEAKPRETSQFVSGCLLAAPSFLEPLALALPGAAASGDFLEITLATLRAFGVGVREAARGTSRVIEVQRGAPRAAEIRCAPDASLRCVFACAAAVSGGRVRLRDGTGVDRGLAALRAAGARVAEDGGGATVDGPLVAPLELDADPNPDLVPPLVAAALFAPGVSRFRGIARLRGKESDRVAALAALAEGVGGEARVEENDLLVSAPRPLHGAALSARGDHRVAMAAALVALAVEGVEIDDAACVSKSARDFFARLDRAVG